MDWIARHDLLFCHVINSCKCIFRPFFAEIIERDYPLDGELLSLIIIIKSICLFCATPCYTLIVDDFDLLFNGQHRVYRHSLAHCLWTNTRVALQIDCLIVPYCSMFIHIYPQLYSFIYIHPIFQLHLPSSASKFLFRLNTCARRCNLGGQNC